MKITAKLSDPSVGCLAAPAVPSAARSARPASCTATSYSTCSLKFTKTMPLASKLTPKRQNFNKIAFLNFFEQNLKILEHPLLFFVVRAVALDVLLCIFELPCCFRILLENFGTKASIRRPKTFFDVDFCCQMNKFVI